MLYFITFISTESGSPGSGPSYISMLRDKENSLSKIEGNTRHYHSPISTGVWCQRGHWAKWLWHHLRTKQEIAGWVAKAFICRLQICRRMLSLQYKKYTNETQYIPLFQTSISVAFNIEKSRRANESYMFLCVFLGSAWRIEWLKKDLSKLVISILVYCLWSHHKY